MKQILGYEGMFNIKFLSTWTNTHNFKIWNILVDKNLANFSPLVGFVSNVTIYYENGDYY